RALRRTPEKVHELLRFSTEAIKLVCRDFAALGAGFTLCDPVASGTILRKEDYRTFVFPYTRELVEHFHGLGCSVTYHICGNTTKILEPMVDTGVDVLSIDNIVDLKETKERVGDRICVAGNVDPVRVMLEGTPEDVEAGVKLCFDQAWDTPKGYILATGCGIPNAAPAENVFRFMDAARKYGREAAKKLQERTAAHGTD
ncbi:MAG: uroporphyrinogen decarboxylase family protein, partial [Synergistaceae bacterium]|nr:uroporphyrinogen decarboxylase family protein [Synergistaceae bacterium]